MRMTEEEYRALTGKPPKKSKYNNNKPEYYDPDLKETLKFDSDKERDYYLILKDRQKRGEITALERQVAFEILPGYINARGEKVKPIMYIADFTYISGDAKSKVYNTAHVVDVKGVKTEGYKLKKKLFEYVYKIAIEEV